MYLDDDGVVIPDNWFDVSVIDGNIEEDNKEQDAVCVDAEMEGIRDRTTIDDCFPRHF